MPSEIPPKASGHLLATSAAALLYLLAVFSARLTPHRAVQTPRQHNNSPDKAGKHFGSGPGSHSEGGYGRQQLGDSCLPQNCLHDSDLLLSLGAHSPGNPAVPWQSVSSSPGTCVMPALENVSPSYLWTEVFNILTTRTGA